MAKVRVQDATRELSAKAGKVLASEEAAPAGPSEVDILTEIRDELRKK